MTEQLVEEKPINRINRNINPWYIYSQFLVSSDVGKKNVQIKTNLKIVNFSFCSQIMYLVVLYQSAKCGGPLVQLG